MYVMRLGNSSTSGVIPKKRASKTETKSSRSSSSSRTVCKRLAAPCGLRGCKNGPDPFPGRMSYKATKPGIVCLSYLSMFFIVLLFIRAPFYVLF